MVGGWGEHLVELCTFQNQNAVCFYITVFLKETNCFQKMLCHFNLISHIMRDKAVFVRSSVLCTALSGKPCSLSLQQRFPLADD